MPRLPKTIRRIRYTVRGVGPFPIDMLRYDQSRPAEPEDEKWIELSMKARYPIELMLESYIPGHLTSAATPTEARWRFYGWAVTEIFAVKPIPFAEAPLFVQNLLYGANHRVRWEDQDATRCFNYKETMPC